MLYLLIIILGAIASVLGPWWMLPLVAFIVCALKAKTAKHAFLTSSGAAATLWVGYALILIFSGKENLVAKIAALFSANSTFLASIPATGLIISIVTLIASISTGFAGMAGKHLSMLFSKIR